MNDPQALLAKALAEIREIDVATLVTNLAAAPDRYLIVDIREPQELATGMIPEAVHIPMARLLPGNDDDAVDALRAQDAEVCLYCHSGVRSAIAAYALQQAGVAPVVSLAGGIVAWHARAQD
jgi:rhodanese-related sulfurtransferase